MRSGSYLLTPLLLGALAIINAGCGETCEFQARCEGNELVTCAKQESIGPGGEVYRSRKKCEGENPVCIADDSWSSGCFASATPVAAGCAPSSCRGTVHVSCLSLKIGPAGSEQWYERVTDCARSMTPAGQPYACHTGEGNICRPPNPEPIR